MTLALWRLRRTSLLLLVTGIGMIAAVILVCAVPLFSQVALTAGLRSTLTASPASPDISLNVPSRLVTPNSLRTIEQQLALPAQNSLRDYLAAPPEFSLQTLGLTLLSPHLNPSHGYDSMQFYGTTPDHAAEHMTLDAGRLPRAGGPPVEVALTPETARQLHLSLGSTLTTRLNLTPLGRDTAFAATPTLTFTLVGLFTPDRGNDTFWHGNDFRGVATGQFTTFKALVANDALLNAFTQLTAPNQLSFVDTPSFVWSYRLDPARVTANQVNDLIHRLAALQAHVSSTTDDTAMQNPTLTGTMIPSSDSASPLEKYRDRMAAVQVPVEVLSLLVVALVLFFVAMMTELLVDRQTEAIAVLRSRGASRQQIFGALATQSAGIGLLALVLGPLLALLVVYFAAQHTLLPQDQGALNSIFDQPWQSILGLHWYALGTVVVSVSTMVLSLYRVTGLDVLAIRREAARNGQRPLWQHLNLDIVAAVIALTGYALSQYVLHSGALDAQTNLLLAAPLALVAPLFLVVAGMLLFLRLFPFLLRGSAWLAVHSRGAVPMLALAQMARTPGPFVRMALLLAFATAFAIFSLVFSASQTRHTLAMATYLAAADFSGSIVNAPPQTLTLAQQTALYRRLPGVTSASLGYQTDATVDNDLQSLNVRINAIDPTTFAQTTLWPDAREQQQLAPLLKQFVTRRASGVSANQITSRVAIPAIVDSSLWNALSLAPGSRFELMTPGGTYPFIAIARVDHIPPLPDSSDANATSGILADYSSFRAVYEALVRQPLDPNYVWLRTRQDAASLAAVRTALSKGTLQLSPLYDRQAFAGTLYSDPLYLDLSGILTIGAITALFLALLGDLLASWLSARTRLTNFAILRALGTAPWQVASVLTWEQCIVYAAAIVLGILFGLFLSLTVVPSLVFTSVPGTALGGQVSSAQFFILQHILPVQVAFPPSLGIVLVVLLLLCIFALTMMARVVSKPSMSQTLRLNAD